MSILFIAIFVALCLILSYPIYKLMVWALVPQGSMSNIRRNADCFVNFIGGSKLQSGQNWKEYFKSLMVFNICMFVVVYLIIFFQHLLPLNPAGIGKMELSLIFNTASSFVTNTNLQHYSGETSLSYFSQIFGIMWLQFVSAATGMAALTALARGLAGNVTIGNFYQDMLRSTMFVLIPISTVVAILLLITGVPMTFDGATIATTIEGVTQTISKGPVAAFVAIKQLGTNGGGFFGVNSSHPLENPTFYSNVIECMSLVVIPMAAVWFFGHVTGRRRHSYVIFGVMFAMFLISISCSIYFETKPTQAFNEISAVEVFKGNLEGKELRFGEVGGPLWSVATTSSSNGSVNSMHDSYNPLGSLIPLANMWLNTIFGGVGVGIINLFAYIIVAVFICGMMVGRTPEYFGKKVETPQMKLALLILLIHPLLIFGGTALFAATPLGASTVSDTGIHGFTEILYEFTSSAANNGSGFEGLGDNTVAWNIATGLVMLIGRFVSIVMAFAIVAGLAAKKSTPETIGTLHTDTVLFGFVLFGAVIFIGALLFMPVAVLGPIAEHLRGI